MNDIRRTILWVIFAFSLVLLWDKWQVHNGHKATFFPVPQQQAAKSPGDAASGVPASADGSVPNASAAAGSGGASDVPGAAAGQPVAAVVPRQDVVISSDVLRLVFDSEGGSLKHAELLTYFDSSKPPQPVVLFDDTATHKYLGQTGLIGGTFPTHKTPMTAQPGARELKDGQDSVQLRFESAEVGGVKLVKTYTLKRGAYDLQVQHDIVNTGTAAVNPRLYMQLVRDNSESGNQTPFYSTFTGPAVYTAEKKYQKVTFKDIDNNKASVEKTSDSGYVAMVQHYFASAWLLGDGIQRENFVNKVGGNLYAAGMITPVGTVEPGQTKSVTSRLFAGPQVEPILESLAPGLELVKDYGWLTIMAKPLYWLLSKLHSFIGNWGWSIVALVLLLKIAFYWLNAKAYSSMAKMKAINPKIQEMRERLKDKPQQMQQEMMRIYREEKVNPMGGCFPIIIQMPVFMALYWVLQSSVEIRNAPWIGWIHDLSMPDPFFILPLLMMLSSLLQTALNPAPPDPMQAKMMWIMPLMFSVMFFFFPSGLVLYWLTNNILSIAQQWIINTRMGVPPQFNLPKFK